LERVLSQRPTFFAVGVLAIGAAAWGCSAILGIRDVPELDDLAPVDASHDTGDADTIDRDGSVDAGPPVAKILAVHAANDLPAVRICFAIGSKDDGSDAVIQPLPALPYDDVDSKTKGMPYPGVFPGTGSPIPSLGIDLESLAVTPYLIDAAALSKDVKSEADRRDCTKILASVALGSIWKLPTIPAKTLKKGSTIDLVILGCKAGVVGNSRSNCPYPNRPYGDIEADPANNGGAGNLHIVPFSADRRAVDRTKVGAQFIHASAASDYQFKLFGSVRTMANGFLNTVDGGATLIVGLPNGITAGQMLPANAAPYEFTSSTQTAVMFVGFDANGNIIPPSQVSFQFFPLLQQMSRVQIPT
jgi:hypothetical protein